MILIKRIFLIFILSVTFSIASQNSGDLITLTADVPVSINKAIIGVSSNISINSNNRSYLGSGWTYRVVRIKEDIVELKALDFKNTTTWVSSKKKDSINKNRRLQYNNKIYTISKVDFERFSEKYTASETKPEKVSIGIITLPFKARFNQENLGFDTEFNFNSTVSFHVTEVLGTSFNLQLGAGIGTVGLNKSNTNFTGEEEIQAQDVSTLTVLSGVMLEHKRIQVGLYLGWDHINNQEAFNWEGNGDAWLGFGVGFSVFKVDLGHNKDLIQD